MSVFWAYLVAAAIALFGALNIVLFASLGESQKHFFDRLGLGRFLSKRVARQSYLVTGVLFVIFGIVMLVVIASLDAGRQ